MGWLLIAMSVASIAIIVERAWQLLALRGDVEELRVRIVGALASGGFASARPVVHDVRHPAGAIARRIMAHDELAG